MRAHRNSNTEIPDIIPAFDINTCIRIILIGSRNGFSEIKSSDSQSTCRSSDSGLAGDAKMTKN